MMPMATTLKELPAGGGDAARDRSDGNGNHEALAQVGAAGLSAGGLENGQREAEEQNRRRNVGHDRGNERRGDHEAEDELAGVGAGPFEKNVDQAKAPLGLLHDNGQREHRDDEEQRRRRVAREHRARVGGAQDDERHGNEQSDDADRKSRGRPKGGERKKSAERDDAFASQSLRARNEAGACDENNGDGDADQPLRKRYVSTFHFPSSLIDVIDVPLFPKRRRTWRNCRDAEADMANAVCNATYTYFV